MTLRPLSPARWARGLLACGAIFAVALLTTRWMGVRGTARQLGVGALWVVLTVAFELEGQPFVAMNGGPGCTFSPAISLFVNCETQKEMDYFWDKLTAGGDERAQQCGWLKDKFGVSWQIIPTVLPELVGDPDSKKSQKAMEAMLQMKKLDINVLKKVYAGAEA